MSPPPGPRRQTWTYSDGYAATGRLWDTTDTAPPPAAVLYLHGIQSHGGWFETSAGWLAQLGLPVVLPDRRGSGQNAADRGDVPHRTRWLADVDELHDWITLRWPGAPVAVLGVSWGGMLATAWAQRRAERTAALLLVTPGLVPIVDVTLRTRLAIGRALLTEPTRRFDIPLSDPALFTDNRDRQSFITADDLKLTHATARFLFQSDRLRRATVRAHGRPVQAPVTLLLANQDRIINSEKTAAVLQRLCAQPPAIRWLAAAHTLEFEADTSDYRDAVEEWGRQLLQRSRGL